MSAAGIAHHARANEALALAALEFSDAGPQRHRDARVGEAFDHEARAARLWVEVLVLTLRALS